MSQCHSQSLCLGHLILQRLENQVPASQPSLHLGAGGRMCHCGINLQHMRNKQSLLRQFQEKLLLFWKRVAHLSPRLSFLTWVEITVILDIRVPLDSHQKLLTWRLTFKKQTLFNEVTINRFNITQSIYYFFNKFKIGRHVNERETRSFTT